MSPNFNTRGWVTYRNDRNSNSNSNIDSDDISSLDSSVDEEIKISPEIERDLNIALVPPLFDIPEMDACSICLEDIKMINIAVMTCGHTFHSSCIFKSIQTCGCCPLCRNQLVDEIKYDEDEDEDEEDDSESGDGSEYSNYQDEEVTSEVTLDQLTTKLINLGYSMKDIVRISVGKLISEDEDEDEDDKKYTAEYLHNIFSRIDLIIAGEITLSHRDTRSYATVTSSAP
jgi:hypothetical protein